MPNNKVGKYHVLYLEDNFQNIVVDFSEIQDILNVQIFFAQTVEEAVEFLSSQYFDLFILGIEIKGERTTSVHLAKQIRQLPVYTTTPILFTGLYAQFPQWLFSQIRNCSFLSKPFTLEDFIDEVGISLGILQYVKKHYVVPPLLLSYGMNSHIGIDPYEVSYIETINRRVVVHYTNGKSVQTPSFSGAFKGVLAQIDQQNIICLRQIYRSIIVNVNQIKAVEIEKNTASVYLFGEVDPLPLSTNFRKNIHEYL